MDNERKANYSKEDRELAYGDIIYQLYSELTPKIAVCRNLMLKYKISERNAYYWIEEAKQRLSDEQKSIFDWEKEVNHMINNFEEIAFNAFKKGDNQTALRALQEITKIKGLYKEHNSQKIETEKERTIKFEIVRNRKEL